MQKNRAAACTHPEVDAYFRRERRRRLRDGIGIVATATVILVGGVSVGLVLFSLGCSTWQTFATAAISGAIVSWMIPGSRR